MTRAMLIRNEDDIMRDGIFGHYLTKHLSGDMTMRPSTKRHLVGSLPYYAAYLIRRGATEAITLFIAHEAT